VSDQFDQSAAQPRESEDAEPSRSIDAPRTGDIVIDAALTDLAVADAGDLDAILDRGEAVHRTLQGRLADLGG
jgi:hypothetical protein